MSLRPGEWHLHRDINSPASEATKPGVEVRTPIDTNNYGELAIGVTFVGGTNPDATIAVWARDKAVAAGDEGDWYYIGTTSALSHEQATAFPVNGLPVYLMTETVNGAPTAMKIKVSPLIVQGA